MIIGHNQDIAWGFTNLGPDVTDLYLEAVDGESYLRGKKWVPFERREETIEVAGEEPFTFTVRSSVHGPLLSDVSPDYASVGANAPVPAERAAGAGTAATPSRWRGRRWRPPAPPRRSSRSTGATSWDEFREAARDFAAPSQNMVYADTAGHIGYQAPGLIPIRKPANTGDYPSPGWDQTYDWTGKYVPFDAAADRARPRGGVRRHRQPGAGRTRLPLLPRRRLGLRLPQPADRRPAGEEGHAERRRHGRHPARHPRTASRRRSCPTCSTSTPGSRYYSGGQRLLRGWDFTQDADSAAAAYFNAVWRNLLAADLRRPAAGERRGPRAAAAGSRSWPTLLEEPNNHWWDDVETDGVKEGRDDILLAAVRDARDELVRLQSGVPSNWTWGHQHTLHLENQTIGAVRQRLVGEALVNRGPWELGRRHRASSTPIGWNASEGYEVDWVPSMRMVVSLADLDDSTWVNLTGASGHAFSPHYTDQTELWAERRDAGVAVHRSRRSPTRPRTGSPSSRRETAEPPTG